MPLIVLAAGAALSAPVPASAGAEGGPRMPSVPGKVPGEPSRPRNPCRSKDHPEIAERLGARIRAALAGRAGTVSVAVADHGRGLRCALAADRRYDSASVVKATVLGALLRRAADEHRAPTAAERSLAHAMITRSDNRAASTLWRSLGRERLARFAERAGMSRTVLGPGGYWGLTQITAHDQLELLARFTRHNDLLPDRARAYALRLLREVVPAQGWGTPAGCPHGVTAHVKNGWLPRHGRFWRVHSIGAFEGPGRSYTIVVLTRDTPSMAYGVTTIERVARAVHRTLNPGMRAAIGDDAAGAAPGGVPAASDGSVPPGR